MIDEKEYFLDQLGEECNEVAQVVSKCIRFGEDDIRADRPLSPPNKVKLVQELNDMLACVQKLVELGVLPEDWRSVAMQQEKRRKMDYWAGYAITVGQLRPPPDPQEARASSSEHVIPSFAEAVKRTQKRRG